MEKFLRLTAWTAPVPPLYGSFHIFVAVFGIGAAYFAARCLGRKAYEKTQGGFEVCVRALDVRRRTVSAVGLVLLISEIYKQLFCLYIVDGGVYDWHRLPFQLCSLPMYFCLILPWLKGGRAETILSTFMADFNLMGAVMAFADPSGFFSKYMILTVHGVLWHILVIFIGFFVIFANMADVTSVKSFRKILPLFFVCCCTAAAMNVCFHPYGGANMFYIDPYTPSVQLVFRDIAARWGIAAGNIIYIAAMVLGGFICHLLLVRLWGRRR